MQPHLWRDRITWPRLTATERALTASPPSGSTILVVLAIAGIGLVRARELEQQFFPAADRDMFQIRVATAGAASTAPKLYDGY